MLKMNMEGAFKGGLIMALSAALLWHFLNIWRYGEHLIREPNQVTLVLETVLLGVIHSLGVYWFVKGLSRDNKVAHNKKNTNLMS